MSLMVPNRQQDTGLKVVDNCRKSVFSHREMKTQSGVATPLCDSEANVPTIDIVASYQANSVILPENT
jgi:hypothetical protein